MSIVNVSGSVEYSVGLNPCTVLVDTTDSIATVMGTGYLNSVSADYNVTVTNKTMCLVNTTDGLIWLQASISGENTSLIYPKSQFS